MTQVYLGLGSNLGDRAANLWEAVRRLARTDGLTVGKLSRLYETAPVGPQDQSWFLNAVVRGETQLSPHALLQAAKHIEKDMGRKPDRQWGPRLIDIDLLLFGGETVTSDELVVPHPQLWNRRFVLIPLVELLATGPLADRARLRLDELGEEQEVRNWPR